MLTKLHKTEAEKEAAYTCHKCEVRVPISIRTEDGKVWCLDCYDGWVKLSALPPSE